jgi:metallo-beta-lactamase family protein
VVPEADVYITEGTYGNRSHDDTSKMEESVAEVFNKTLKRGGKIIVPAFSVERTQELVYIIHKLLEQGKIPKVPMFVDSPLSTNVTQIFKMHPECYDEDTYHEFIVNQQNPFGFNSLKYITKVEDSKALNEFEGSCVIIAASGMCENGRIVHHLRAHIENPSNTIMIIGYQAEGTLGRKLVEQEKEVTILGESYTVNAEIRILNAFSAHADEEELVSYASQIKGIKQVFVVHGEQASLENLAIRLREALKLSDDAVVIPELFKTYEVRA